MSRLKPDELRIFYSLTRDNSTLNLTFYEIEEKRKTNNNHLTFC